MSAPADLPFDLDSLPPAVREAFAAMQAKVAGLAEAKAMPAADGSVIGYGVSPMISPKKFWALENHFNRTSTIPVTVATRWRFIDCE